MSHQLRPFALTIALAALLGAGCATETDEVAYQPPGDPGEYLIGVGDVLRVFVWRNEDLSALVPVRPDGQITAPLVDMIQAEGRTPTQLAREIEERLSGHINSPVVNVIVESFVTTPAGQIRVLGEIGGRPQAMPYRAGMTLLDVIIAIGGLSEFAGNKARLYRGNGDEQIEIHLRVRDLVHKGDITANVPMHPGDILIIRE